MRFFTITVHFMLACLAIGIAAGMAAENFRPLYQYAVNGIAAGLGISVVVRLIGFM